MFLFGNLLLAVARILDVALNLYLWIVIIAALLSWVSPDPHNPIVRFLRAVTEPVFRRIRRLIGFSLGPVDISPLVVILGVIFVRSFLINSLIDLGYKLKGGALL